MVLTLRILIDLDGSDEPAWNYLDQQHGQIMDNMRRMYDRALENIRGES